MGTNDEKRKKWVNRCWVNPNGQWIKSQLTWSLHKIGKYIFFSRAKWGTEIDDLFVYLQSTDNLSNASEPSATKPPFGELVCVSEWVCFIIMQHVCNLSRSVRCQIELKPVKSWPKTVRLLLLESDRISIYTHNTLRIDCIWIFMEWLNKYANREIDIKQKSKQTLQRHTWWVR